MQQNHQFVESLIGLREHYQALNEECGRKATQVREQLIHVNALLVEQLVENQQFVESLIELRIHYQGLNEEYERKVSHARKQLTHVNALLAEQLVLQHGGQQPVFIEALTIDENENKALTGTADIKRDESLKEIDEPNQPSTPAPTDRVRLDESTQSTSPEYTEALPDQQTSPSPAAVVQPEPIADDAPRLSSTDNRFKNTNKKQAVFSKRRFASKTGNTKVDVLPQYRSLSNLEAVMQLLQSNAGTILHVDYIVRTLYGDLEPRAFKVAKDRVSNTLYTGHKQKNLWAKVPDQVGCYTLDLKLLDPDFVTGTIS